MNSYISIFIAFLCIPFQVAHSQNHEGTFRSVSYKCPISNMAEGYLITPQGEKIEVASYPFIVDGQYIKVEDSSWETKECENKTYKVYYIKRIQSSISNEGMQHYEGVFTKVNYKCPIQGAIEGYITTSSGHKIEIASSLNLTDGQYIKVNAATWETKKCENKTYKVYYINRIQDIITNAKNEIYPEEKKLENNGPTIVAPSISSTGSKISVEDAKDALAFHNKARMDVGVEPLSWSIELSIFAQEWADYLASQNCTMIHRPNNKNPKSYGENIFRGSDRSYTGLFASQSWYSEIKMFQNVPINETNLNLIGHYTQMVWHNTTKVGIGIAYCANGSIIIVANYDPPGNYFGQKAY